MMPQHAIAEASTQLSATERLVSVAQELSMARNLDGIMKIVRAAARELTGADGATFVLRDGDLCFYADEDAIAPLWKGQRFPMATCISGWAMQHKQAAIIEDIYVDPRIPKDAYRVTFVKSLAMVPIRSAEPVGAIGNYWRARHLATEGEVKLLRALADLTSVAMENVHLYEELQWRMEAAHAAVTARDEFIAVAAHELRTPLTAVLLQVQALEACTRNHDGHGDPKLAERASRAAVGAQRLAALIDGMVDASRAPGERLALELEELDFVEMTRGVIERFSTTARRSGSVFHLESAGEVRGRWDRLRMEQVLTNLIANALKFGAGKPVEIEVHRRQTAVHVEVRDHGNGIAPELAGRIFERFGRAGPVRHYGGLGLGLYLAREVIEAHGGTIGFRSAPGEGCTFLFDMPLQPAAALAARSPSA